MAGPLFRSMIKPYNKISSTISRWLTQSISMSGNYIDSEYWGHSVRRMATSKAKKIMNEAEWRSNCTFTKHYYVTEFGAEFGKTVLKLNK